MPSRKLVKFAIRVYALDTDLNLFARYNDATTGVRGDRTCIGGRPAGRPLRPESELSDNGESIPAWVLKRNTLGPNRSNMVA
jgi:hypothetical protein